MNKIYITSLHLRHGGIERIIVSMANAFVEKGFDVEILCTYNFGEPAYLLDSKVKVTYLTSVLPNRKELIDAVKRMRLFKAIKEFFVAVNVLYQKKNSVKKAFCRIKEGTIISTRHENNILLSKYGNANVLKIAQLHVDHAFDKKLFSDFKSKYNNIDYFVLLTDRAVDEIGAEMSKQNNHTKLVSIPNFIDIFVPENTEDRLTQVVSVGRLHYDKNFERLLEMWARIAPKYPEWTLKIIGEGELERKLKDMAAALNIEKSVIFTGALPHSEVIKELSQSGIYAMTSRYESFGIALVEAMSQGCVPVAFDVRVGPEAIIDNKKDGFLIPDNDEAAFISALAELMNDDGLCSELSKNASEKAKKFSKENVMDEWLKILNK